jgi:peptide/nickel transport system permease protein
MFAYLVRRLLSAVFVVLFIIWFTFTLQYLQKPYGVDTPAYGFCPLKHTYACLHPYIVKLGLDQPYFIRMYQYIEGLVVHFNLGFSYKENQPVWGLLKLLIPRTFWLAGVSLALAIVIALPLGIYQAWRRNSGFDYVATGVVFILYSIPAFVLALVLLDAFSFHSPLNYHLPNSPPTGVHPWAMFTQPAGFILPIVTLAAASVAGLSRFMRSSVLDVLVQDYVRTAKAKGCSSRRVLFKHTMRNALGPIITIIGLYLPVLLGGALIVEDVFNYLGIGQETVIASTTNDSYTLLAITIIGTVMVVIGNLLADLGLAIVNPRVRIEGAAR